MQYANALIYCFVILLSSATWPIECLEVFNHEWLSMSFPRSSVSLGSVKKRRSEVFQTTTTFRWSARKRTSGKFGHSKKWHFNDECINTCKKYTLLVTLSKAIRIATSFMFQWNFPTFFGVTYCDQNGFESPSAGDRVWRELWKLCRLRWCGRPWWILVSDMRKQTVWMFGLQSHSVLSMWQNEFDLG